MKYGDKVQWEIELRVDDRLRFALYIRDTLRTVDHMAVQVPPLTPAVAQSVNILADKVKVADQWTQWWNGLLRRPAETAGADYAGGQLPAVVADLEDILRQGFVEWKQARNWVKQDTSE